MVELLWVGAEAIGPKQWVVPEAKKKQNGWVQRKKKKKKKKEEENQKVSVHLEPRVTLNVCERESIPWVDSQHPEHQGWQQSKILAIMKK